ncbi:MAG: amino acid ABC transporter substrate-binding protein [Alphaproteobacteria bacterium]|nr:amino acid ABC transporter substrate-binding protein [Alphaproteobacteria bacterium]
MTRTLFAITLAALVTTTLPAAAQTTLANIRAKGHVQCGTSTGVAGFSIPDSQGKWSGFDTDFCKALGAAVFGDPEKVKYTPLTSQQRLVALQTGEIDVLARTTTWTMARDTASGLNFTAVNYYDGQGFLVPKKSGVKKASELNGAAVCVVTGTTTELNLSDFARAVGIQIRPVVFEKIDDAKSAFFSERCDAYTTDASQLASTRATLAKNPDDYVILPELISKEPLAPAVRHGDDQWYDIVKWVVWATIEAEEKGVTSKNVDEMLKSADPGVQRLLGVTGEFGKMLGLDNRWAYNVIKQVGNYSEIFERHLGMASAMRLERGVNALWTKGGLMYPMPIR